MAFTTVLSDIPAKIIAGDSVSWKKNYSDYLASESWVLTYALVNAAGKITITGTASGDDHLIELTALITAAYTAGVYDFQAYVTNTLLSERYLVGNGSVEVKADFASQASFDARTHAKIALDAIEAVLESRATRDQENYSIAGRSLSRTPVDDLLRLRDYYRSEHKRESSVVSGKSNQVKVRF